jgi:2-polyprenyl-6-methoxyphenol hydroxylase-like FAD-dependent oxidoreductase
MPHPTALIVGAGIGGLAAGLALKRAGWQVRIFERAAAPRELGFALGLAPNAMRALRRLGVADAVLAHAGTAESLSRATSGRLAMEIRRPDGRVLRRLTFHRDELRDAALPAIVMRPALHTALLQAVGQEIVQSESEVVGFEDDGGHAILRLANDELARGDALIGADGVASVIRRQLHPNEPPPAPSGYFALRGASRAVPLLEGRQFIAYFGRGIEVGVVQASETMVYWYVSLLADDVKRGPLDAAAVLQRFTSGFDAQFQAIARAAVDMRLDELFVRDPLLKWGAGPVTLLGDAAHPMLPHTGQGAAQALEDAVALGDALAAPGNRIGALRAYERHRASAAAQVVRLGPRLARLTTTRNPIIGWGRTAAIRFVPQRMLRASFVGRRDPLPRLDAASQGR